MADDAERVVLARRTPNGMVEFQWTGAEPEGLNDLRVAEEIGAVWEGNELVTHNIEHLMHNWTHRPDGWMEDSD